MAKRKRQGISKSTRFEVFKRDSFTCQYCGAKAPEAVLQLDHIDPHSKGGSDEAINLITSCVACNSGKSDRRLSDDTVASKQHAQLAELQERREQLEMMLRWRDGLAALGESEVNAFASAHDRLTPGWSLNENGRKSAGQLIKKFGLVRSLDAVERAAATIIEIKDGKATKDSVDRLLGLTFVMAEPDDVQSLYRLRARIRRRWNYVNDGICIRLLRKLLTLGAPVSQIESECDRLMAERGSSFRWWCTEVEGWISQLGSSSNG